MNGGGPDVLTSDYASSSFYGIIIRVQLEPWLSARYSQLVMELVNTVLGLLRVTNRKQPLYLRDDSNACLRRIAQGSEAGGGHRTRHS